MISATLAALLILLIILILANYDWNYKRVQVPKLKDKHILIVVASKGFNPVEFKTPKELFEESGAQVSVASTKREELISERWPFWSLSKLKIKADILIQEVSVSDYDAFLFVGGGEEEYLNSPYAHKIAQVATADGRIVAAICKAPLILANAGILKGKKAAAWHLFVIDKYLNELREKGATPLKENVVVDGKLVTANRPIHASLFTEAIGRLLAGQ